jgi:hypothetical protein
MVAKQRPVLSCLRMPGTSRETERQYVIETIRNFLADAGDVWDWDDFISCRLEFHENDAVRQLALELPHRYPPSVKTQYCGEPGFEALRKELLRFETGVEL